MDKDRDSDDGVDDGAGGGGFARKLRFFMIFHFTCPKNSIFEMVMLFVSCNSCS